MIDPTPAQTTVLREVRAWLSSPFSRGDQVRLLTGAAGTGKTSLAALAVEGMRARFCAPTGKAALVLREKGCAGARTIHSLIYRPREGYVGVDRVVKFSVNPNCELANDDVDAVVADECSMIDARVLRDLLTFRVRVLLLGDPYQLPPVDDGTGAKSVMGTISASWHLNEVHRQARESGVLRLATDVREGRSISRVAGYYGDDVVVTRTADVDAIAVVADHDQVLVGTRKARTDLNRWVRQVAGVSSLLPVAGDKVVCRRNNSELGLVNGGQWTVLRASARGGRVDLDLESLGGDPDGPQQVSVGAHPHYFEGREESLQKLDWREVKRMDEFDYAYAMTVHSAQGSQWDSVAVLDESASFGKDASKWMYTATTRASKRLTVLV